ncbi:MAG: hypothetical protein E7560_05175 [Ruminococcaceae bacterium]|nr:hypothetical protein [Oscillospiraceae bacterium]
MKNAKNICLLIGIVLNLVIIIRNIIFFVYSIIENPNPKPIQNTLIIVTSILLTAIPIVLFVRNLKNKSGKALPIICIIINAGYILDILYSVFIISVPQYLTISKVGLLDTYLTVIMNFITNGGILVVIGCVLLIIGSVLSCLKKE